VYNKRKFSIEYDVGMPTNREAFMRTVKFGRVFASLLLITASAAPGSEKKIKIADLPPAVQSAVQEYSKGAAVVALTKEVESGVTLYEAELKIGGRTKDVTFDPNGKVVIVEEETTLDTIPTRAREAITRAIGNRKLLLVETVSEKGATFYEAHFRSGLRTREVKVDSDGRPVN
jgi:hypothetical protein